MTDENRDKYLGMNRPIGRRDFLNGLAMTVGTTRAVGFLPGLEWMAEGAEQFAQDKPGYYPPTRTGMRGSHDGSFESAHSARDGNFWNNAGSPIETGETKAPTIERRNSVDPHSKQSVRPGLVERNHARIDFDQLQKKILVAHSRQLFLFFVGRNSR